MAQSSARSHVTMGPSIQRCESARAARLRKQCSARRAWAFAAHSRPRVPPARPPPRRPRRWCLVTAPSGVRHAPPMLSAESLGLLLWFPWRASTPRAVVRSGAAGISPVHRPRSASRRRCLGQFASGAGNPVPRTTASARRTWCARRRTTATSSIIQNVTPTPPTARSASAACPDVYGAPAHRAAPAHRESAPATSDIVWRVHCDVPGRGNVPVKLAYDSSRECHEAMAGMALAKTAGSGEAGAGLRG